MGAETLKHQITFLTCKSIFIFFLFFWDIQQYHVIDWQKVIITRYPHLIIASDILYELLVPNVDLF